MAETLHEVFIIKAISKVTGDVHYVEIDNEGYVSLVKSNSNATIFDNVKAAEEAIAEYCDGEETHKYTVDSMIMSLEELMTEH
jgi:hypothetical protein